jgi:uncharacterized protein YjbJ (UPF0337 family)
MSNSNTSTLGSYVDSAIGAAQSVVGNLTGNTVDQSQGQAKQDHAQAQNDLSHTAAKVGPVTVGPDGVATDNKDRTTGSYNQTMGAAKEAFGGLVGAESLKQAGIQQNRDGKAQEAQGQVTDYASGISDRVTGALGSAAAGLTGNTEDQAKYNHQHDSGKTLQRGVETELQKEAAAQQ